MTRGGVVVGGGGVMPLGEGVTHHGVGRGGQCGQTHT